MTPRSPGPALEAVTEETCALQLPRPGSLQVSAASLEALAGFRSQESQVEQGFQEFGCEAFAAPFNEPSMLSSPPEATCAGGRPTRPM